MSELPPHARGALKADEGHAASCQQQRRRGPNAGVRTGAAECATRKQAGTPASRKGANQGGVQRIPKRPGRVEQGVRRGARVRPAAHRTERASVRGGCRRSELRRRWTSKDGLQVFTDLARGAYEGKTRLGTYLRQALAADSEVATSGSHDAQMQHGLTVSQHTSSVQNESNKNKATFTTETTNLEQPTMLGGPAPQRLLPPCAP